jgi:hypothetical protein
LFIAGGIEQLFKKGDSRFETLYSDANVFNLVHIIIFLLTKRGKSGLAGLSPQN